MKSIILAIMLSVTVAGAQEHRSSTERLRFIRASGHPKGWPGHIVDHRIPLCAGGPDIASNMRWQTVEDAAIKDRFEKALCAAMHEEGYVLVKRSGS